MMNNDTMESVRELTRSLKPKHQYTLMEIARGELIPWARDHRTIIKLIEQDANGAQLLAAKVEGDGRQRRYTIEGKNLKKYLTKTAPLLLHTARKPKQYDKQS